MFLQSKANLMLRSRMRKISDGLMYVGMYEKLPSTLHAKSENLNCKFLGFIFDIRCWIQLNYSYWWYMGFPDFLYMPIVKMILGREFKFFMEHKAHAVAQASWFCSDLLVIWHHYPEQLQVHYKYNDQVDAPKDWVKFFSFNVWHDKIMRIRMNKYGLSLWMLILFILSFIFFFFIFIALAIAFLFAYVFFLKTSHEVFRGNDYKAKEGEFDMVLYPRVMQSARIWFKGTGSLHMWGIHFFTLQDIQFETRPFMAQVVLLNKPEMCLVGPPKPGGLVQLIECKYVQAYGQGEDIWMFLKYRIMNATRGCHLTYNIKTDMSVRCTKYSKDAKEQVWSMAHQYGFANLHGPMKYCMNILPNNDQQMIPVKASNTDSYTLRGNDLMKTLSFVTWYGKFEKENLEETFYFEPDKGLYFDKMVLIFGHPPRNVYVKCDWKLVYTATNNHEFAHRIYFDGRLCWSIQVQMSKFHPLFGNLREGKRYRKVISIRYVNFKKISHNALMGVCFEDYESDYNNLTIYPIGDIKNVKSTEVDVQINEMDNQLTVNYKKATLKIAQYSYLFKSLISQGAAQRKSITEIVYSTKNSSKLATKMYKYLRNRKGGSIGNPGETEESPAIDCWHVKMENYYAANGYYWIKPFCGYLPMRAYCDFYSDLRPNKSYVVGDVENMTSKAMRTLTDLKTYLQNVCKMVGKEYDYIDIADQKDIIYFMTLLKDSKHDLFSERLQYLIAFNPACSNGSCSAYTFKSIPNPESNVNDLLSKLNAKLGGENFNKQTSQNAIIYSGGNFKRIDMTKIDKTINKVLCSNNGSYASYTNHTCKDTLGSSIPNLMTGQNLMIQCKKKCKKSIVYGSGIYSSDSNVCAAAAHSKAFLNFGGVYYTVVGVVNSLDTYDGSFAHGVKSLPKKKRSAFGFSVGGITCNEYIESITLLQTKQKAYYNEEIGNNESTIQNYKLIDDYANIDSNKYLNEKLSENTNYEYEVMVKDVKYMESNLDLLDKSEKDHLDELKKQIMNYEMYLKKDIKNMDKLQSNFKQINNMKIKDEKKFDYRQFDFEVDPELYDNDKFYLEKIKNKSVERKLEKIKESNKSSINEQINKKNSKKGNNPFKHKYHYNQFKNILNNDLKNKGYNSLQTQEEIKIGPLNLRYPSYQLANKFKTVISKYFLKIAEKAKDKYTTKQEFDYNLINPPSFALNFMSKYDPIDYSNPTFKSITNPNFAGKGALDDLPEYYDPDFFTKDPWSMFKFDDPSKDLEETVAVVEYRSMIYDHWILTLVKQLKFHFTKIYTVYMYEVKFIPLVVKMTVENEKDVRDVYLFAKDIFPLFPQRYQIKEQERDALEIQREKMQVYETFENIIKTKHDLGINFYTVENGMADGGPSQFEVTEDGLTSHLYGIVQKSKITSNGADLVATFLINAQRKLFDGLLHLAVKYKADSRCTLSGKCAKVGLVFRYVDMFNHYGVVIYNKYLTLYLMVNSEYKVLYETKHTFKPNKWYQIAVELKTKYIKVGVIEEEVDTQIQSGVFSFSDEKKITAIFKTAPKNLVIKTTDGTITSGKYGMLCDNCMDSVFDALKVKTKLCQRISESHSDLLCPKYVKRFRINWSAPLENQFKFITLPSAIVKPAIYLNLKEVDGFQHLISLNKYIKSFDYTMVSNYFELMTDDDPCLKCINYCQFDYTFKVTSQYCSNLTFGVKFKNITEQISIRLEGNNNEKGTKIIASLFHQNNLYELFNKPKILKKNLITRNEFHSIQIKLIDEKIFVTFIQNSLKDRIPITLLNYTHYDGHENKEDVHKGIKSLVGTMAMGNNNCQIKIKDIKMGPVDPGVATSDESDNGKESQLDTSEEEQDEDNQNKKKGEERSSFTEADLYDAAANSTVREDTTRPGEKKEEMKLLKQELKAKGHDVKNNVSKELLIKLLEHRIKIKLDHYKSKKLHDVSQDLKLKIFSNLPVEEQKKIEDLLSENEGLLALRGRAARLPVEMWYMASKCLTYQPITMIVFYCKLRTGNECGLTQQINCYTDFCGACCADQIPSTQHKVYSNKCLAECHMNNREHYNKPVLQGIESCWRNTNDRFNTCDMDNGLIKEIQSEDESKMDIKHIHEYGSEELMYSQQMKERLGKLGCKGKLCFECCQNYKYKDRVTQCQYKCEIIHQLREIWTDQMLRT